MEQSQLPLHEDIAFADLHLDGLLTITDTIRAEEGTDSKLFPISNECVEAAGALCVLVKCDGCMNRENFSAFIQCIAETAEANAISTTSMHYQLPLEAFSAALAAHLADLYEAPSASHLLQLAGKRS